MFEKILLAVDGSAHSSKTVTVAVDLAKRYDAEVTVLHVREQGKGERGDVDLGPAESALSLLDGVVATLTEAGLTASAEVRKVPVNRAPQEIVAVAKDAGAGLIVMGARGWTEWKSLLVGGVANKVVTHAECPVLLVR
ncbi:MAG: universal stress protein [Actinomycetota bacterium]